MKVDINNIVYMHAKKNYTSIITNDEKYMSTSNLKQLDDVFSMANFMRTHRSYIVNLNNLTSIDLVNNKIFIGIYAIPFSRSLREELTKKFNLI